MKKIFTSLTLALGCLWSTAAQETSSGTVIGGIEFIDMGTSVLWATQPLGVTETSPYGSLYMFGAPEAIPEGSYFNIWGMESEEWGGNPKCDAATAALGSGVLTPSKADFEALLEVCSFTYGYDYSLKRDVLTLTSSETGNTITITGAGYYSFGNDHSDASDLYLYTSTGVAGDIIGGYIFSGQAALSMGKSKALYIRTYATSNAYQILPVFDINKVVKAEKVTLNASELTMSVGDKSQLEATVEPAETSNPAVTWDSSDDAIVTVSSTGEIEAVGPGVCTITATCTDGSEVSGSCTVTVLETSSSMTFVDMGLSVLWGEHEIGATSYEETGDYFAWGTIDNANDYLSATAAAYKVVPDGPCTSVARDLSDPTKPYDVATELLGGSWHTPDKAEWKELIDNTTVTRVTINGVNSACFTSNINGNKIYMRGTGYIRETSATPSMSTSVIRQTSDAPANLIYDTKYVIFPAVNDLPRQCFWLVPIRPVCAKDPAAITNVTTDIDPDCEYDIYDVSGRFVAKRTRYTEARTSLRPGIYIFVSPDGHHLKVAL